jgi:hypothetical protein
MHVYVICIGQFKILGLYSGMSCKLIIFFPISILIQA